MKNYDHLLGVRKGKMVVTGYYKGERYIMLYGVCDCGVTKSFEINNFKRGNQLSCGCSRTPKRVTHNYKHPLYKIWLSIKARCYNKNDVGYKNYGGRGVVVCAEWLNSYQSFYDWCILNGWKEGLFVDKDTKGANLLYSPETCSIVTRTENNRSRRNVKLDLNKAEHIRKSKLKLKELSNLYGVNISVIYAVRAGDIWKQ